MNILYPTQIIDQQNKLIIFLAGPIRCTANWQSILIDRLLVDEFVLDNVCVASPRGETIYEKFDTQKEKEQIKWETHYLSKASENGIIVFFLANQTQPDENESYARTTRFELGEWFAELKYRDDITLIVGHDGNFQGYEYIKERMLNYLVENPHKKNQLILCERGIENTVNVIHDIIYYKNIIIKNDIGYCTSCNQITSHKDNMCTECNGTD